jgi:hypothetical protein
MENRIISPIPDFFPPSPGVVMNNKTNQTGQLIVLQTSDNLGKKVHTDKPVVDLFTHLLTSVDGRQSSNGIRFAKIID